MGKNYSLEYSNNKHGLIKKVFRKKEGEDFVGSTFDELNLQGANFSGQDLTGSSFIGCNIQGAIFRNAILRNCNFNRAIGGIRKTSVFVKTIIMLSFNALFIVLLQIIGQRSFLKFSVDSTKIPDTLTENVFVLLLISVVVTTFNCNSKESLKNAFYITSLSVIADITLIFGASCIKIILGLIRGDTLSSILLDVDTFASRGVVGIVTGIGISLLSIAIATAITTIRITGFFKKIPVFILVFDFILLLLIISIQIKINTHISTILISSSITLFSITNGFHFTNQALKENNEYTSIFNVAINIASWDGTNFQGADLTKASFNFAKLKLTNFRDSDHSTTDVTQISWYQVKCIDLALFGDNYLKYSHVRRLLTEREAKVNAEDINFDGLDLAGINLGFINTKQTQLERASFFRTNLSNANLEQANLKQANLKQANLDGANLNFVEMTGACIEDWGVTRLTKKSNITCEYIYTHLRADNDPYGGFYRIPREEEGNFAVNGFELYIKSILDTLEVYHKYKINIDVVIQVLEEVTRENHNVRIEIVGFDDRGNNQSTLRLKTNGKINIDELASLYYSKYNQILPTNEVHQSLIPSHDNSAKSLQSLIFINGYVNNINNIQGNNISAIQGNYNKAVIDSSNLFNQTIEINAEIIENLTQTDILQLLNELELFVVEKAEILAMTKAELREDISAIKTAIDRQKPNKRRALERLICVNKTLEKTSKNLDAGQEKWTAGKSILAKVAKWLLTDASF